MAAGQSRIFISRKLELGFFGALRFPASQHAANAQRFRAELTALRAALRREASLCRAGA